MNLSALLDDFVGFMHSPEFHALARAGDQPSAFTRRRKLPLPTLVSVMLCGLPRSVQAELDCFFGHLQHQAALLQHVSAQAFAQARTKLAAHSLGALNDFLIGRLEQTGALPRWHGLRLVAADASPLRLALRASHVPRAAPTEQIAFGLYLPGAEMMLRAALYSPLQGERQMLFEHLDALGPDDLLLLDRGYPASWLVSVLNHREIAFCMRVDKSASGFAAVEQFIRSGLAEQQITLSAPPRKDATDYQCPAQPQSVRLVRQVAPSGAVRVLMTNLLDTERFPAELFAELYHRRWRIEEAFKRLKHRLNLELVSGLSQSAVRQDFDARILCDNLEALVSLAARQDHDLPEHRRINRAYAHTVLKPLLPALLLGPAAATATALQYALQLIARRTFRHRPGRSKPSPPRPKPQPHMNQKPCSMPGVALTWVDCSRPPSDIATYGLTLNRQANELVFGLHLADQDSNFASLA